MEFRLNENEERDYKEFCNQHRSCEFRSTIGGKISVIFILLVLLAFGGCKSENTVSEEPVKINMPEDDSVNGYRLKESENTNYNTIDADKVAVQSDKTAKPDSKAIYCANKNSKIFHKSTCFQGVINKYFITLLCQFQDI